jgi:hypothetical protein
MSDNVQFKMEPSGGETAKLDARDFVHQFDALLHALQEVGVAIDGEKSENVIYRIECLSTNSPATAEISPEVKFAAEFVNVKAWHDAFYSGLVAIREGAKEIHHAITAKCVQWLKKLASPIGEHVHRCFIAVDGREFVADAQFKRSLQQLDACDRVERMGFMKGMVERMNIHKDAKWFNLYPFVGPESVACRFLSKDKETAKASMGRYVRVHGDLHYHWREKWPFQITVSAIELLPVAEEMPKFSDLWGCAPDATGDKTSEQFIEDIRNG